MERLSHQSGALGMGHATLPERDDKAESSEQWCAFAQGSSE